MPNDATTTNSVPSLLVGTPRRGRAQAGRLRHLSYALFIAATGLVAGSITLASPAVMALGTGFVAAAFLARDLSTLRRSSVTPITLFALGVLVTASADFVGFLSADGPSRPVYFLYAIDEHLLFASQLLLVGSIATQLGFRAVNSAQLLAPLEALLPRIGAPIPSRWLLPGALAATGLSYAMRFTGFLDRLGAIGTVVLLLPVLSTFVLARYGAKHSNRSMVAVALVIALVESARGAAFAYLRSEAIGSQIAFVLGVVLGTGSLRVLRKPVLWPVYVLVAAFVWYFGALGEVRGKSAGLERLRMIDEFEAMMVEEEISRPQTFLSRFTSFNQMSQIARVVREDGLYDGETLEYLGYAFIPRVLWPEKPVIAKGGWFALRIGQARTMPDGRISNSVNMTIPGELYLNFGWLGVLVGGVILGMYIGLLWRKTQFWSDFSDPLRGGFGYYLFLVGLGLGADLQIVVTMMAMYLVFVAVSAGIRTVVARPAQGRTTVVMRRA